MSRMDFPIRLASPASSIPSPYRRRMARYFLNCTVASISLMTCGGQFTSRPVGDIRSMEIQNRLSPGPGSDPPPSTPKGGGHRGKDRIPDRCASPGRRHTHISPPTDRLSNDVLVSPPRRLVILLLLLRRRRPSSSSSPPDDEKETAILGIAQCLLPLSP